MMLLQARKSQLAYARTWGLRWWDAAATLVETERYCSITAMSIDLRNHNGIREGCCGRWTQGAATGSASPHWWQYQEKDLAVAGPMEAGSCCACSGGAIMQLGWMAQLISEFKRAIVWIRRAGKQAAQRSTLLAAC